MGLDLAVTQVLDIFPDEDRDFVRAALRDPSINGNAETLIATLLEGPLPPALAALKGRTAQPRPHSPPKIERRNIFDDQEMDFSKLQIGKDR